MASFLDILRLIRWANCLLAAVGVWIGAYLTWLTPSYYGPAVAGLGAFLICAAGNVLNDLLDMEGDRINHPHRVMVRGAVTRQLALRLVLILDFVALVCGLAVSWWLLGMAAATIVLLTAYNLWLKKVPLAGNVVVALLAGLTFITGGMAVDPVFAFRFPGAALAAVFAFLFHLVREILKDVQDLEGDRRVGRRTLALVLGSRPSLTLTLVLFLLLVLATYVPVFFHWFGRAYTIIAVYVVDLPLLALLIFVWGNPTPRMLSVGSTALKFGMVLGLIALLAG